MSGGYRSGAAAGSMKGPALRPTVASIGLAQTRIEGLRCLKAVFYYQQTPKQGLWCLKKVFGDLQTRKQGLWCLKAALRFLKLGYYAVVKYLGGRSRG